MWTKIQQYILAVLTLGLIVSLFIAPPKTTAQVVPSPPGNVAMACAFNTSPPTIPTNNFLLVQCDSTGHVLTNAAGGGGGSVTQGTSPWVDNITQLGSVALGGATGWGVAPSGNVIGVNANVLALPSLPAGSNVIGGVTQSGGPWSVSWSGQSVAATQSGTWNIGSITTLPALAAGSNLIGTVNVVGTSTSGNANSHGVTSALATSLVLKASAGNLYSYNCTAITGGAAGYCVAINATSAPSNGASITPLDFCYFNSAGGCSQSHGVIPINYGTGIVILATSASSPYTYTTGTDTAAISGDYQ